LDTVDAYQELLATLWKKQYKTELPEDLSLHLGEFKHKLEQYPLSNTEVEIDFE
jgi:hypothetical protein